ncbi:MAG: DUF2075 domain-containing protein [Spirochaetales bacterium]|nr:DUF2075 domain-containing protein [Spirochaetales bacterium]
MIVYSGSKKQFSRDAINGVIAGKVDSLLVKYGIPRASQSQFNAFSNSLPRIALVIENSKIDDDVQVAIEYQIPLTSKRVDLMIAGSDGIRDNVVIVELKQWENCSPTQRENVVKTFTGGAERDVAHPSQQAFSYAKLIENYNEDVRINKIGLIPCAYLHNFKESNRKNICNKQYNEIIKDAPVFLQEDGLKLSSYIAKYVREASNKKLFDIIENGKLLPSKSLQEEVGRVLNGNTEFEMIDEQQVAYATVLKLVEKSIDSEEKHTIIVQGGPGTGKSVIAINLLAKILNNSFSCAYVTKTSAPRYTFQNSLIKGKHSLSYLKGLFKSSGSFVDTPNNTFSCLIVDESHRLKEKSGRYSNYGENQIKEIINAAKVSVFFIDEDQIVSCQDIGSIEEIKKQAKACGSKVYHSESLKLTSQFRCNGSDGYLAFLDDVLQIRRTANGSFFDMDYDVRVFDDALKMKEELRKLNGNNKARMIAGYCYPWKSKNDKRQTDIVLPGGFMAQWNFTTDQFASDPDSFEQVGCIHSTQGLEFEYVGIIVGLDLRYENGTVITDYTKRDKGDATIRGLRTGRNNGFADRIIRNTYKTLLSRGQKGCFIYCQDTELGKYIKERIRQAQSFSNNLRRS